MGFLFGSRYREEEVAFFSSMSHSPRKITSKRFRFSLRRKPSQEEAAQRLARMLPAADNEVGELCPRCGRVVKMGGLTDHLEYGH